MKKTRIHISVDENGLIIENINGGDIAKSLKVICSKITDSTGVAFSGLMKEDDEDGQLKVLFSEEISEEKGDEIDNLLSEINGTSLTYIQTADPEEVARAASKVYLFFNVFIRTEKKLKGIPDTAMSAWDTLRDSLGLIE